MLGLIQKLGRFLLYGGFGGPKAYETKILEMTVAALSEPDAQSLARQIGHIERMQRWNEDRMVIVGFEDKALLPKLRNEREAHCLAKFRLKGEFGSVTAAVMTHRGVFSSLEFRPSPATIKGHDFSVELVALHASDPGISSGIDAEEHARPV